MKGIEENCKALLQRVVIDEKTKEVKTGVSIGPNPASSLLGKIWFYFEDKHQHLDRFYWREIHRAAELILDRNTSHSMKENYSVKENLLQELIADTTGDEDLESLVEWLSNSLHRVDWLTAALQGVALLPAFSTGEGLLRQGQCIYYLCVRKAVLDAVCSNCLP